MSNYTPFLTLLIYDNLDVGNLYILKMDLKTPTPLGDNKNSKKSITEKILEIDAEKKSHFKLDISKFRLSKRGSNLNNTPLPPKKGKEIKKEEKPSIYSNLLFKEKISLYVKNNKEKIINISIVAVPILILLILVIVIINYTKSEPYRLASEFLKRIEKRDYEKAYDLTTDTYKTVYPLDSFKKSVEKLNTVDISNPKVISKRLEKPKDMGEYAHIKYRMSGYYVSITIFNDDTKWGIHSIEIENSK